jgi:KipI family sensor histidine kinase inhibitor
VVKYLPAGDTALTVEFGDSVERPISAWVLALFRRLSETGLAGVVEAVPTLRSLTVHYDPNLTSGEELQRAIAPLLDGLEAVLSPGRKWVIPACYAPELAPDLEEVARRSGLSPEEVVRAHAGETYRVYMLGFLPGLPYMGDLPDALRLPRRETPRIAVPAGSVAVATTMTAIYPLESPGGWHLIGRTPIRLFDAMREQPVLLAPGDEVRFTPVERAEFDELEAASRAGSVVVALEGAAP